MSYVGFFRTLSPTHIHSWRCNRLLFLVHLRMLLSCGSKIPPVRLSNHLSAGKKEFLDLFVTFLCHYVLKCKQEDCSVTKEFPQRVISCNGYFTSFAFCTRIFIWALIVRKTHFPAQFMALSAKKVMWPSLREEQPTLNLSTKFILGLGIVSFSQITRTPTLFVSPFMLATSVINWSCFCLFLFSFVQSCKSSHDPFLCIWRLNRGSQSPVLEASLHHPVSRFCIFSYYADNWIDP